MDDITAVLKYTHKSSVIIQAIPKDVDLFHKPNADS